MPLRWAAQLSGGALQWGAHFDAVGVPAAPSAVAGNATGGTTAALALTDNTAGTASHRWQLRLVAGTWADAAGATNPSAPGVVSFAATGLSPATEYEVRARAEDVGGDSAYVAGANFWTDNTGDGDVETPVHAAPSVVSHPSSATVAEGALASFTAAFNGYPAPEFQWYRDAVLISGATSGTYSFTTVLADSGAEFTCTATNIVGSVTSSAATLTVTEVGSMEEGLVLLLETFCPRVFPETAPLSTQRPYITYQQIGGRSLRYIDNTSSGKRHAIIQINVWGSTRMAVSEMAFAIEDAMCITPTFVARPDGAYQSTVEEDLGMYGTIQTFSIWAQT